MERVGGVEEKRKRKRERETRHRERRGFAITVLVILGITATVSYSVTACGSQQSLSTSLPPCTPTRVFQGYSHHFSSADCSTGIHAACFHYASRSLLLLSRFYNCAVQNYPLYRSYQTILPVQPECWEQTMQMSYLAATQVSEYYGNDPFLVVQIDLANVIRRCLLSILTADGRDSQHSHVVGKSPDHTR